MPTYQYACTACDERLEVVQKFSDEPLTQCPACEGRLRKVFSAVGVVFKGSGFYKTDSRATAGKSKGGSGEATGGDSAAAAKPESAPAPAAKAEPAAAAKAGPKAGTSAASSSSKVA